MQNDAALNVHPAEGRGLRDRPLHRTPSWCYREALDGSPEVDRGIVAFAQAVSVNIAPYVDAVRRRAQANHFGVVADRHVHVVLAGEEKEGRAFGSELISPLKGVDLVNLLLNRSRGHRRIEDQHIRPKIRSGGNRRGASEDKHTRKQSEEHRSRRIPDTASATSEVTFHFRPVLHPMNCALSLHARLLAASS